MATGKIKKSLLIFTAAALIAATGKNVIHKKDVNLQYIIGCAPSAGYNIVAGNDGKFITVLPGWGDHAYAISTNNDSAQLYFNQGLTLFYSYHPQQALASFKEAARFDSNCAILYWGQALAMGPNYNASPWYKMDKNVIPVLESMNNKALSASAKEKDLIAAMNKKYDVTDTNDTGRNKLNNNYAEAMKMLVAKYPEDADIKALYIDAVMVMHTWDFWNNDGTPQPWTPELVQICKEILQQDPHHPAGLHYYIHLTEASRDPEVALFCAASLQKLFPGVAHMVHMSSHEFERIGYYSSGVDVNKKATQNILLYDSLAKGLFPVHGWHYDAVQAYCALSGAMAISESMIARRNAKPDHANYNQQYQYMFPELAMVRTGKWNDILNDTSPVKDDWPYAIMLRAFAKGMAYTKQDDIDDARTQLLLFRSKMNDPVLQNSSAPFLNTALECAAVPENILDATISFQQKKYADAITALKKAIIAEDKLKYSEPKQWLLPARQYLGAYLLQLNKPKEAEAVYRQDLIWNPGNGWSLLGLYQSLIAQNKNNEAAKYKPQYMHSFSRAEETPTASAY